MPGDFDRLMTALRSGRCAEVVATLERVPSRAGLLPRSELSPSAELSALHLAAAHGRADVVEELLRRGASARERDRDGRPPLYHALHPRARMRAEVGVDRPAVVAALLAAAAELDDRTTDGHPLHWACAAGDLELARQIAAAGAPIEIRAPETGCTPLAAGAAHREIVDWLLEQGASPAPSECRPSPLAAAIVADAHDCVAALRAAGAVLAVADHEDVMLHALQRGPEAIALAVELGVDPSLGVIAAVEEMNPERLALLVELGADVNRRDDREQAAIEVFEECRADLDDIGDDDDELVAAVAAIAAILERAGAEPAPDAGDGGESLYERFGDLDRQQQRRAILEAELPADGATLGYVALHGPPALIGHYVDRGARLDELAWEDVFDVARLGESDRLEALLDAGLDPGARGGERDAPLIHGPVDFHLHHGVVERLQMLLDRGAGVDARDARGWTALMIAAARGEGSECGPAEPMIGRVVPEAIDVLIGAGAALDARSRAGYSVAHAAALGGLGELLERSVAAGADPGAPNQFGRTPLHEAARGGHLELVRWLLDRDVEVDRRDCTGATPLLLAIAALKAEVAVHLVEAGADLEVRDVRGHTPLILANKRGALSLIPTLIGAGADVAARDHRRRTPLHHCCDSSAMEHMASLLAFKPAGEIESVERGVASVAVRGARILIESGADVNAVDVDGQSPLHVAASQRMVLGGDVSPAMCELLVAAGADPALVDAEGKSPLDRAAAQAIRLYLGATAR